jgi:hypothetical protein
MAACGVAAPAIRDKEQEVRGCAIFMRSFEKEALDNSLAGGNQLTAAMVANTIHEGGKKWNSRRHGGSPRTRSPWGVRGGWVRSLLVRWSGLKGG